MAYDTVKLLPLRENWTTGALRGFVGLINVNAVPTCDKTGTEIGEPAFWRKVTFDVIVSGRSSAAAMPVVLPASPGNNGLNFRQNV